MLCRPAYLLVSTQAVPTGQLYESGSPTRLCSSPWVELYLSQKPFLAKVSFLPAPGVSLYRKPTSRPNQQDWVETWFCQKPLPPQPTVGMSHAGDPYVPSHSYCFSSPCVLQPDIDRGLSLTNTADGVSVLCAGTPLPSVYRFGKCRLWLSPC